MVTFLVPAYSFWYLDSKFKGARGVGSDWIKVSLIQNLGQCHNLYFYMCMVTPAVAIIAPVFIKLHVGAVLVQQSLQ